jgi:hypothetical protein
MSYLLTRSGGEYRLLFALGAGALGLALLIDLIEGVATRAVPTGVETNAPGRGVK